MRCTGRCGRPAVICDECRRAVALLDSRAGFASISRHPEGGRGCRLCAAGEPSWCVEDWLEQAQIYRATLIADHGHRPATEAELDSAPWAEWPNWWCWGGLGPDTVGLRPMPGPET